MGSAAGAFFSFTRRFVCLWSCRSMFPHHTHRSQMRHTHSGRAMRHLHQHNDPQKTRKEVLHMYNVRTQSVRTLCGHVRDSRARTRTIDGSRAWLPQVRVKCEVKAQGVTSHLESLRRVAGYTPPQRLTWSRSTPSTPRPPALHHWQRCRSRLPPKSPWPSGRAHRRHNA